MARHRHGATSGLPPVSAPQQEIACRFSHDWSVPRFLRFALAWVIVIGAILLILGAVVWVMAKFVPQAVPQPTPTALPTAMPPNQPTPPAGAFTATVMWISDGDTIGAKTGSRTEIQVRLIGIDTPETKKPNTPVQCYGPEATAKLTTLIPKGTRITAAYQSFTIDKYKRELWDIWMPDGRFVQGLMVTGGFARTQTFGGTNRDATYLKALEAKAQAGKVGMWGACPN